MLHLYNLCVRYLYYNYFAQQKTSGKVEIPSNFENKFQLNLMAVK